MKKIFTLKYLLLVLFFGLNCISGKGQSTIFSENIGTPTGTTAIATYATGTAPATFQNKGTLTYSNGGAANPADVRITSVSSGYTGASANGNIFFTSTSGEYGFSIESINVAAYSNLTLQFGYRKESATAQATFSVEYWDGSAWNVIANTSANLFNEAANAAVGWYLSKPLSLPAGAQINGLKIRFVKTGTASIRVDDVILTGQTASPTTTSISPTSANAGSPTLTLTVNGTNFSNASTVTWNGSNRTTTFINSTQLTASIPSTDLSTPGNATVGVTTTGASASSNTQTFIINPVSGGIFTLTSSLADFGNVCINTIAGPNSFTIDGSNLDGSSSSTITVAALAGFTYSATSAGTYTSTLSFTYTGNSFSGKIIYVKFNPTAIQSYNGNIFLSGGGVTNYPIPAKGSGVYNAPAVTTGGSSAVTPTSGTVSGNIDNTGCAAITAYGIEYSTSTGFPEGTGTKVAGVNLSGGNFSVNLTGLAPNTRYYYKAYATNSIGTTYGTQQAFTCPTLPVPMASQTGLNYTEDFHDIANWTNFFIGGEGANHWNGLSSNTTAPGTGIPNPVILTASTTSFQGSTFLSSGGVQKGTDQAPPTQSIVLLSTGASPENSSSAAIDFYMDFTGVNAGTLSFDWASVNNTTGDRKASLRVYGTTDGTTFTEITTAAVLNFTNNTPTNGTIANVALPAAFNNSATARLRFYFSNGTGGTTGSRPKVSIDNLNVTAVPSIPCNTPIAQPTAMVFGTKTDVSIQGSFTAANPSSDQYLTVVSTNNSLTSNPIDGLTYNVGDALGDGTVIAKGSTTSFTATGLSPSTIYYFFTFAVNGICTGGPKYLTTNPLTATATTNAALPSCTSPTTQASTLVFGTTGINSIQGSFTATTADGYLVLVSTSSSLSANPVNGQAYNTGDVIGNASVVQRSTATSFTANGLSAGTQYYFYIFSLNSQNCVNGPAYNITAPLTGTQTTQPLPPCVSPTAQPTYLTLNAANTSISGAFTGSNSADDYLVVRSTSSTLSATPVNNTDYPVGTSLGGGVVVSNSADKSFFTNNLSTGITYYFFVFAANKNCSGGTKYLTTSPLIGSITTTAITQNNFYFGTLHSHSDYSDGNQDHPGYIPTDDYNYAMTAQCMDFLGISEHNHFSSPDNPGNTITNYHKGPFQADAFTAAHPNFLAMYGMEWGVISGGGHVVVYGDGMNSLFGWESGSGGWGSSNNYDVYVPKSTYIGPTGLFKVVNDSVAQNTFATLAHPNLTDFNNIANIAYIDTADNAITGVAVESGPATTTNVTYSNPGSAMYYLWYYQTLLSKGYHLGPTVDHDNHNTTFGHTTYSRTAVIAPSLTKTEIIKAMRNMHFYATEDCDSKVDFTINTKIMGSVFSDRNAPSISVSLADATTSTSSAIIRIMYGKPGSGIMAVKVDSVIGNTLYYVDNNLANGETGYYYVDISNGSTRIITSPIWYTRKDVAVAPEYFRSVTSGNWNSTSTWESSLDSSSWHAATTIPDFNSNSVTIQSGHTVTVSANVVIDHTSVNPNGVLVISRDVVLTVNNSGLTIKSTAAGTGSIGNSAGTISGSVTVQRYTSDKRAWRLLGIPFSSSTQTIKSSWMEGATNSTSNPNPGFGTHITTFTGDANAANFDASKPASSIRTYAADNFNSDATHTPNTTSLITANPAYFLFVRGSRRIDLNLSTSHGADTLRITGTVNSGNVTKGVSGTNFSLIPNPYPSAIDFDAVKATNTLINTFYVWDASLGSVGQYRTVQISGTGPAYTYTATPIGEANSNWRFIESGTAFMIPGIAQVNFTEAMKSTRTPPSSMLRTTGGNETQLAINLYTINADNTTSLADGVREVFDNSYSTAIDKNDAKKIAGFDLNLGISSNSEVLAIEKRPLPNQNDVIALQLWSTVPGYYQFAVQPANFSSQATEAYLKDNYLNTYTAVSLKVDTKINFVITTDAASTAQDRFSIVFSKPQLVNPTPAIVIYPNPVTNGMITLQMNNMPAGNYSIKLVNALGQIVTVKQFSHAGGSSLQTLGVNKIKGVFVVEIIKPDNTKFSNKVIIN